MKTYYYCVQADLEKFSELSGKLAQLYLVQGDLQAAVDTLTSWQAACQTDQLRYKQALEATVR
jgi:hypothetical protein